MCLHLHLHWRKSPITVTVIFMFQVFVTVGFNCHIDPVRPASCSHRLLTGKRKMTSVEKSDTGQRVVGAGEWKSEKTFHGWTGESGVSVDGLCSYGLMLGWIWEAEQQNSAWGSTWYSTDKTHTHTLRSVELTFHSHVKANEPQDICNTWETHFYQNTTATNSHRSFLSFDHIPTHASGELCVIVTFKRTINHQHILMVEKGGGKREFRGGGNKYKVSL